MLKGKNDLLENIWLVQEQICNTAEQGIKKRRAKAERLEAFAKAIKDGIEIHIG